VRDEDAQQAVALAIDECGALAGDVEQPATVPGMDRDRLVFHIVSYVIH
jgi:hypothetical protein